MTEQNQQPSMDDLRPLLETLRSPTGEAPVVRPRWEYLSQSWFIEAGGVVDLPALGREGWELGGVAECGTEAPDFHKNPILIFKRQAI